MKETVIPVIREETRRIKIVFELKKDLQEDEVICEHCHGTGLEIADNVYGITGDTIHVGLRFPYKHQSLRFCKHCYEGILKKCPKCGSLRGREYGKGCPCGHDDKLSESAWKKIMNERWEKAEKMSLSKAWELCNCLYVDDVDRFIFGIDDLENVFTEYFDYTEEELKAFFNGKYEGLKLPRIYLTEKIKPWIDAVNVIESACNGLHETAIELCDEEGLQKLLDEWCAKQDGAVTYVPDYKRAVEIQGVNYENT
jgi:hypothetical protein